MAEQAKPKEEEKKDDNAVKMQASKELFDKRIKEMDLTDKTDFIVGDKYGYLCDDGVLIEVEVARLHSKGGKIFCSLGQHHRHLSETHTTWIDIPSQRMCSLEKMSEVQIQLARRQSTQTAVKPEIQNILGDDKESGDILNALTKQPSVLDQINDLEVEQKTNLVTTDYVFKSIDSEKNKITCLDGDYNEITFDLDASNKDLVEKVNKVIEDGKSQKKDVTIVVTTLDKNDKLTSTVSDAKI